MAVVDHRKMREEIYDFLDRTFPASKDPREDALQYVITNRHGKLARPLMVVQTAQAYNARSDPFPHAAAVELLHRATLILDDLPSMDNARKRQGLPSCWVYCAEKYGKGTTIEEREADGVSLTVMLAPLMTGTYAPRLVDQSDATRVQKDYIRESLRSVAEELTKGQCRDLGINTKRTSKLSMREHLNMYIEKTGSLYAVSAQIGGKLGNASDEDLKRLKKFGRSFGVAYQLLDDWKDLHSTEAEAGKPVRLDAQNERPNLGSRLTKQTLKTKIIGLRREALRELRNCNADLSGLASLVEKITAIPF